MHPYPSVPLPPGVQGSVTTPIPGLLGDTRVDDDLDYEWDGYDNGISAMHGGGALAESPSNRPVFQLRGSPLAGSQETGEACTLSESICVN